MQMLDRSLEENLRAKWAWDREWPTAVEAGFADWPAVEMKTLTGEARL